MKFPPRAARPPPGTQRARDGLWWMKPPLLAWLVGLVYETVTHVSLPDGTTLLLWKIVVCFELQFWATPTSDGSARGRQRRVVRGVRCRSRWQRWVRLGGSGYVGWFRCNLGSLCILRILCLCTRDSVSSCGDVLVGVLVSLHLSFFVYVSPGWRWTFSNGRTFGPYAQLSLCMVRYYCVRIPHQNFHTGESPVLSLAVVDQSQGRPNRTARSPHSFPYVLSIMSSYSGPSIMWSPFQSTTTRTTNPIIPTISTFITPQWTTLLGRYLDYVPSGALLGTAVRDRCHR